ncbi:MAG: hypothetical protein ABNH26_09000 [Celeribacter sp.]|jgi:hypothetical protein
MGAWVHLIALLRAGLLCAVVAAGLTPEQAAAHDTGGALVHGESHAAAHVHAPAPHGADHSVIAEAFGDCHPGLDCAVSAMIAPYPPMSLRPSAATAAARPAPRQQAGIAQAYDPPPPRSTVRN